MTLRILLVVVFLVLVPQAARAFCGFYVGKADAGLFNDASQVIYARDGDRSVITMLNDYRGPLAEFAMVVPVPEVLAREAIRVVDKSIFERIDAYSAPRLAEYFDPDPCQRAEMLLGRAGGPANMAAEKSVAPQRDRALGVAVEARYTVGEYDIVLLSARQSNGLETWLRENGYRMPPRAGTALAPYIKQGMKFFVARVNLGEHAKTGGLFLRPLQFGFKSEKFMLPIRLGTLNARGPQDLVIYMLTRQGRVETTNYRTVQLPANMDLPTYLRSDFPKFYKAMFDDQVRRERMRVVFTEYFWDMGWCDPCAANPLTPGELRTAGVFWLDTPANPASPGPAIARRAPSDGGAQPAMLTRLHVRYTAETFPEDLMFQQTNDRRNYQTRYVLRHAWSGSPDQCEHAGRYLREVAARREREAQVLANLTGWNIDAIRSRMAAGAKPAVGGAIGAGPTRGGQ